MEVNGMRKEAEHQAFVLTLLKYGGSGQTALCFVSIVLVGVRPFVCKIPFQSLKFGLTAAAILVL